MTPEPPKAPVEPAAPPAAPKEPPSSIAKEPVEPKTPVAPKWADDWRQQIAGDDKKELERLGRFASPADVFKSLREAEKKLSEGVKPKTKPGEKATAEEWSEYRKANNIPETVDDFVKAIVLPDKRVIGDDDKPLVAAFSERALKKGINPADMAEMVDEYYAIQEEQQAQLAEKDSEFKTTNLSALKEEWGGDFKANINSMRPYFEAVDQSLFDNLMGGRLSDGTKVGDNANIVKFFVAKSLAENPAATVVPAGANQIETIQTEIKAAEARMRDDRTAWFKDKPAQERLQKLYEAQEKLTSK
ncbi:hypothetical protein LRP31_25490 [Mesorhizobium mediterraneum]|uniref:hypothetical protein n=1 Tax=Mesorhizobium mediterraneum TaxID=43617 RepID=UPI0013052BAD|nr:hypothetical protein [Mesorhizobium mediterraneum]WIW52376.1 hypothetical protein LRP31_25490 [Mesorhizobium mediterraneum]